MTAELKNKFVAIDIKGVINLAEGWVADATVKDDELNKLRYSFVIKMLGSVLETLEKE